MTSVNYISHWFDSTGNQTFDLPHARPHALPIWSMPQVDCLEVVLGTCNRIVSRMYLTSPGLAALHLLIFVSDTHIYII